MENEMKTIYDVPIILRREIEALMIKPFLDEFEKELGHEKTMEITRKIIWDIAVKEGREYAEMFGCNDLQAIRMQMEPWSSNGALDLEWTGDGVKHLCEDVKRCEYVAMYDRIGMKDLGAILSCGRDEPFYKGMNEKIKMQRTRTLMTQGECCDFVFDLED